MCLLLLGWKANAKFPLVLAANRDEFYARPTAEAGWWKDNPEVLAGRDLQAGGTWLGLHASGRLAALTNFREPGQSRPDAPSRGALVQQFLLSGEPPKSFERRLALEGPEYNGFNLIFGDLEAGLHHYSNRSGKPAERLAPGFHGLSNHLLDTPWPKVARGLEGLRAQFEGGAAPDPESLFELLADRTVPEDAALPDTGVGLELERLLGPLFIQTPSYGTRCSTVLLIDDTGAATFVERSHGPEPAARVTRRYELRIPLGPAARADGWLGARP